MLNKLIRIVLVLACLLKLTLQSEQLNKTNSSSDENTESAVYKQQKHAKYTGFRINEEIPTNLDNFSSNRIKRNQYNISSIASICTELIKIDDLNEVKKVIGYMNNNELIIKIVEYLYTGTNEIEVIEFIKKLDSDEHKCAAYSMLYEQMKRKMKLSNPILIELLYHLKFVLTAEKGDVLTPVSKRKIINYATDENSIVKDAIKTLANQDYDVIQNFEKNYRGSFDVITPIFINHYYNGELKNFDKVLKLLSSSTQWLSTKYKILDTLFDEMKKNGQLNSQEILHFIDFVKYNHASHSTLIAKLPLTLKNLFFKDTIKIVSYSNNDYSVYISRSNRIYAYPHENNEDLTNQEFTIERGFIKKNLYFRFKCVENSNVLYSDGTHIYGDKNDTYSHRWKLNPRNNGTIVNLENYSTKLCLGKINYSKTMKGYDCDTNDNTQLWTIE